MQFCFMYLLYSTLYCSLQVTVSMCEIESMTNRHPTYSQFQLFNILQRKTSHKMDKKKPEGEMCSQTI